MVSISEILRRRRLKKIGERAAEEKRLKEELRIEAERAKVRRKKEQRQARIREVGEAQERRIRAEKEALRKLRERTTFTGRLRARGRKFLKGGIQASRENFPKTTRAVSRMTRTKRSRPKTTKKKTRRRRQTNDFGF